MISKYEKLNCTHAFISGVVQVPASSVLLIMRKRAKYSILTDDTTVHAFPSATTECFKLFINLNGALTRPCPVLSLGCGKLVTQIC